MTIQRMESVGVVVDDPARLRAHDAELVGEPGPGCYLGGAEGIIVALSEKRRLKQHDAPAISTRKDRRHGRCR
jgi:hypothetical protein